MVVTGGEKSEAKTIVPRFIFGPGQSHDVLGRVFRSVVESWQEAVLALPGVLPIGNAGIGHGSDPAIERRGDIVAAGDSGLVGAFQRGVAFGLATRGDDFTSTPTGRFVIGGRRGTGLAIVGTQKHFFPVPIFLGVSVAGIDLNQTLPARIMLVVGQLLVPGGAQRGVETPGGSVRDHQRFQIPIVKPIKELCGCRCAVTAIFG